MNEYDEIEIERFTPCKLCDCVYKYRCFDDCKINGCPGHVAVLKYYSTSNTFSIDMNGKCVNFDKTEMDIINDWIIKLKS